MKPTNGISHKPPSTLTQRNSNGYSSPSSCSPQSSSTLKSLLDKSERDKCFKPISSLKSSYFRQTPTNTTTANNENDHDDDSSNENETDNRDSLCSSPVNTSITPSGSYESLNTADIAQKVRDLLSMHNIGQRIFAKYILGLSQGTVSELLSKPKHWDKLTEKGRESYRKMHTWSCSDENINSLKAISPRKGNKDNYFYQSGGAKDDTDLKITQILYEAQKQMQAKGRSVNDGYSASSPSASMSSASPSPINQNSEDENNNEDDDYAGYSYDRQIPLDLTLSKKRKLDTENNNNNNQNSGYNSEEEESNKKPFVKAANVKLELKSTPLKQIQSIADSYLLTTQHSAKLNAAANQLFLQSPNAQVAFPRPSSTPSPSLSSSNFGNGGSKPLKCVLPPVSQEQFDKYSNINTDDLVKKVKDLLSKFSISQRLFGECILGLSQGSVSDLLARPKPWIMLTQKGREPFIRMQMFIDDPEAIKKLMNNHYKGSVEKSALSRSGSIDTQQSSSSKNAPATNGSHHFAYSNNMNHHNQASYAQSNDNSNDSELKNFQNTINIIPYDISALSAVGDLNTEEITNRVKETLLNNNIGQKLFGEAVLNLSQGTVSELLSKPKPWNTLSIKGREPYLRMYMWLSDRLKLEKLNEWKEEKNLLKRNNTEVESDHQKPKRRFIFSEEQKDQLMKAFKYDPYPAVNQMEQLASKLGLQTRTVINWFHNHRMRIRYKNTAAAAAAAANSTNNSSSLSMSSENPFLAMGRAASSINDLSKTFSYLQNTLNGANRASNGGGKGLFYGNTSKNQNGGEYNDEDEEDNDNGEYGNDEDEQNFNRNENYEEEEDEEMDNQDYENNNNNLNIDDEEDEQNEYDANNNRKFSRSRKEDSDEMYNEAEQEAEINSLYIPSGRDNGDNSDNEGLGNSEWEEGKEDRSYSMGSSSYMNSRQDENKSNKRRKPHNPQKLKN